MTINQYISELRVSLPKDYPNIDERTLLKLLNQFRAIYIKNTLNQNDSIIPREFIQSILGIEMYIVSQKEVPFITDNSRILKSKVKIPERIKLTHKDMLLRAWDNKILGEEFNIISFNRAKYAGNGKFNTKDIYCFIYDDYLYIKLKKENPNIALITFVSIEGIFEHPEQLITLQYEEYLDIRNYEYPITLTAWGYIKANILKEGLQVITSTENE